jgi:hypothetical protein
MNDELNRFSDSNTNKKRQLPMNVDILRLVNLTESRNFTCQAQNSFGLVVYNLSLVIKGNFLFYFINKFCFILTMLCKENFELCSELVCNFE